MPLYKYCDGNGKLVLQNLQLKVCPPIELNDECEMRPLVKIADTKKAALESAKRAIGKRSFFEKHKHDFPLCKNNFSKFQQIARTNIGSIASAYEKDIPKLEDKLQKELPEVVSSRFGIVSFSRELYSRLMWAYYADSNRGLVVEFEPQHKLFTSSGFLECEYADEPAVFDPTGKPFDEQIRVFARRKRSEWSHEKESRLIVQLDACKQKLVNSKTLFLMPVLPELIVSVTFGLRAPQSLRAEVTAAINSPELQLQHVRLWNLTDGGPDSNYQREPVA